MNSVSYVGRATKDAEVRVISNSNGKKVCNFIIAVDREYLSKEAKKDLKSKGKPTADFIYVEVKTGQAEACGKYVKKGLLVSVRGRTRNARYEKMIDGVKHVFHKDVVDADRGGVAFLEWPDAESGSELDDDFVLVDNVGELPF